MSGSGEERPRAEARSGNGCATGVGVALILFGGLALAVNLAGAQLALAFLGLLPQLTVWWPALLILWGLWKLATRLRTGRARFGLGEIVLLVLLVLAGAALTLFTRAVEGHDLHFRFTEMRRWARERAAPLPQHAFVAERVITLPPEEPVEIALTLPRGGILVRAAASPPPAPPPPAAPPPAAATAAPPAASAETDSDGPAAAPREARLVLTKRVWAESAEEAASQAEAVRLAAGPVEGDAARIAVGVEDAGDREIAFDLVLTAPPEVRISAVSGSGPIRIRGPFAAVSARGSNGPLEVGGARGEVSLSARDATVLATGIAGPLWIRARRSVVEVESVEGAVSVESNGAPVWIAGAGGSVTVNGEDAPVEIERAVGPVEVEARIAPVSLRQVAGAARVRSDYGAVVAETVGGSLDIRATEATVEVRSSGSGVSVSQTGGSLVLDGIRGPVTVSGRRGEVLATALSGPTSLAFAAGEITVRGFRGPLAVDSGDADLDVETDTVDDEVSLTTREGDVRLGLPAAEPFALRIATDDGEVTSDFALERVREDGATIWIGTAPPGAPLVRIGAAGGDVEIRAEGAAPARESR